MPDYGNVSPKATGENNISTENTIGSAVGVTGGVSDEAFSAEPIIRRERDREYLELKRRVTKAGLLDRQYGYYAWKISSVVAMVATSVAVMVIFSGTL